jgi:nucleoid DNA-binding protein
LKKAIVGQMVTNRPDIPLADHQAAYEATMEALRTVIERDGSAMIAGLGKFHKKFRAGRTARNPRTGETMQTVGRDVITFKQSRSSK